MALVVVDIAQMMVTDSPQDVLVTYSLGSCVGVAVYDPFLGIGGMIHCMLPLSKVDQEKARQRPGMFVDTGLSLLLTRLFNMGVRKSRALVLAAGGAHVLNNNSLFKIGERNITVLRKILWKNGMLMQVKDMGGSASRTIRLHMDTKQFVIKKQGQEVCYDVSGS
ncbi:MAG: chemotaxis protein CheD [Desulfovermiculus sp.]